MNQIIWTLINAPAEAWMGECREQNIVLHHLPLVRIKDLNPALGSKTPLDSYDGIILSSRHGARAFLKWIGNDNRRNSIPIFTIGEAARDILEAASVKAEMVAVQTESISPFDDWLKQGGHYLHPCSKRTPPDAWTALEQAGITVETLPMYEPVTRLQEDLIPLLEEPEKTVIAFGSPSGVDAFLEQFSDQNEALQVLNENMVAAIGSTTGARINQ